MSFNTIFIIAGSIIIYMIGLCFVLHFDETNKVLLSIQKIYLWPGKLVGRIFPYYQHYIINFVVVLYFPFISLYAIIMLLSYLYQWNLGEEFINFLALTIAAVMSLFKTYGDIILEIVGINKIYRRGKLDDTYNVNIIKFEMYLIYLIFLMLTFTFHFLDKHYKIPEYASASFIIYLAADRLLNNLHLSKIKR